MILDIYQVDSFTNQTFRGNPAGVCITQQGLDTQMMLAIADEMAVSETAFLSLDDMKLRWFTPQIEVALCGHGTLAVVQVMSEQSLISPHQQVTFDTLSGPLKATHQGNAIAMDFPTPTLVPKTCDEQLLAGLGLAKSQIVSYQTFDNKQLIEIDNYDDLLALQPQFEQLKQLTGRGVIVTATASNGEHDFVSRYFAPWVGVNEDPVTGSAHCALAVYWQAKLDKHQLCGYQASKRGGTVKLKLQGNGRVDLIGEAVTVLQGQLHIAAHISE